MAKLVTLPEFYDPADADNPDYHLNSAWPTPDGKPRLLEVASQYRRENNISLLGRQRPELGVLNVDPQNSFIYEALAVLGAIIAMRRMVEFEYRYIRYIDLQLMTGDCHPYAMATTPPFTVDRNGNHAQPLEKEFEASDFLSGEWSVDPAILLTLPGRPSLQFINEYMVYAIQKLAELGRPKLLVWPEHCGELSYGQQVAGNVMAQYQFHGYVRGVFNRTFQKGQSPYCECFSPYGPDYYHFQNGKRIPLAHFNRELQMTLRGLKILIVGGLASTHCVRAFLLDMLRYNPELVKSTYVLEDCTAPVPGFEHLYQEAKALLVERGMHFVTSTDPIETWSQQMEQFINTRDRTA